MSTLTGFYFPAADARDLNADLRKEHLAFLAEHPAWTPSELDWMPRGLVRFLNRLPSRIPLTPPLGWIDGNTPADDGMRQRISTMPPDEQPEARDVHQRAIYGRCFRVGKPGFTEIRPPGLSGDSATTEPK